MGEWKNVSLKDIGHVYPSNVDKKVNALEVPVKLCNYMDVYTNRRINNDVLFSCGSVNSSEYKKFKLQRNDVLITKDSETPDDIGIPTVVTDDIDNLVCGYHLALIRPNSKEYNSEYLMYALQTEDSTSYFTKMCNGLTRYGLTISAIEKQALSVPVEIKEQKKIVEILTVVDIAAEKTRLLIDKYKNIKTGLMQDLFLNGIDECGNVRTQETHQYKDTSLGKLPIEWDTTSIRDITSKVGSGATPRGGQAVYINDGITFLRSQNITFDGIVLDDVAYITNRIHHQMNRSHVQKDDILLNITGASIGRCCIYNLDKPANVNQHVCIIRTTLGTSYAQFAYRWLSSFGQSQIRLLMAGGNREGLNFEQVKSIRLPLIKNPEEIKEINQILNSQDKKIEAEQAYLSKLLNLKQGLMQDLLTHKVLVDTLL